MGKIVSNGLRIYRKYLAQYFVFRLGREIALAGYRALFRLGCRLRRGDTIATYRLVAFSEFQRRSHPKTVPVAPAEHLVLPPPQFIGAPQGAHVLSGSIAIDVPEARIIEIADAMVVGGTSFVLAQGCAIHPDLLAPKTEESPAEIRGFIKLDSARERMTSYFGAAARTLPRAINLLGQSAGNYAHWMTEIAPRLAILDASPDYDDWPLLVDGWIHRNMRDAVAILSRKARPMILVERWQPVNVGVLADVSATGYEPYIPHKLSNKPHPAYKNCFSRFALDSLRTVARGADLSPEGAGPEKIYLHRGAGSTNARGLSNVAEIERIMVENGFHLVDPGRLGFAEQVRLCRNARVIAAPVGASLANMIFAPSGALIVALKPYYEQSNDYYYAVLSGVLGHHLLFVLGQPSSQRAHPIHNAYHIDPGTLSEALKARP
ncbi:glycosyltransferase family 61 protein [Bradyrhizobium sp. U87765 SZCCT0131]|uniref:glycosyltransferase family 61 protein n=1 Tax=unclassified Bradyrhizobium TaxID=2631580 RepID=UPI001BA78F12|nr:MULTISPECIES: glycosyltransferase 61 family protein [unclassified Bradyrhizobium]MBR1219658.1 glycosyltransferase family 61 protein [Bradyrhizobium sp. U87765 SZCCT0131]MBR1262309.1 glycosyltransferase family 61 protein [Bradyrhizobium sp. U87765 SZCCT0134]MBR1308508.1 glycosyltransferase family 61 protein [Bradyrhizobium sp. U87765 SZCCT0110]MBR1318091.1 glycosyltransferase family 61 protein [Bradyrhizobium sp. U87765 SZCCT0109]MBR1351794.1 glycosyltransferase family 61 protein [Bradyrhizo